MAFGFGMSLPVAISTALGNQNRYAAIINDAGELAPYVTFTRSSTATRYNSAGLLETVAANAPRYDYDPTTVTRANLVSQSEFKNGVTDAPSRGGNVSATPFVGLSEGTGLEFGATGVTTWAYKFNSPVSTRCVFSVFVRMNDGLAPSFGNGSASNAANSFAIVIAGAVPVPTSYTVQNLGGGLYRVSGTSAIGTDPLATGVIKYATNDNRSFKVSGYQLETGSTATAYIPTTASPAGNATLRGLLIEEQRTNSFRVSSDFSDGTWSKGTGVTVTSNTIVAPDGTLTADAIQFTSGGSTQFVRQTVTLNVGTVYTVSVFALLVSGTPTFNFDIGNGPTPGSSQFTATSVWQRFSYTFTYSGTSQWIDLEASTGGSIAFWGAQLEAGAFATSYIPTTTAAVTRAADAATISNLSSVGYNAAEGSFFAQGSFNQVGNATRIINVFDGSYANQIYFIRSSSSIYSLSSGSGGTQDGSAFAGTSSASLFKLAGAYKVNDYAASLNGGSVGTDSSVQVPIGLNQAIIGSTRPNTEVINGHIRLLRYYPRRLTNAQLQAITA